MIYIQRFIHRYIQLNRKISLGFAYFFRDLATFMISAMLHKDDTNIHVIMNFMRIWKINAEVKIILLGVGVWHGLLTLQWVTMQMPIMATSMASHTPVKAPNFSLTKKPNWCWPNHNYGFEYALWRTTERTCSKKSNFY